ncbi:hypothetical protein [Winogradskyella eximia]|jgi:hypothetical protein|uniref:hypothetical protein n=1 Tax=Winogradskyella eximia TaxID=262006 RepID=UPI0024911ECC|nr:hypothetical protein [Winogradskyella eximia]
MKPRQPYLIALLFALIFSSCSPEDNTSTTPEDPNVFIFNGVSYPLVSAIITDENTTTNAPSDIGISLFNKTSSEITGNEDLDTVAFVYFDIHTGSLENTTYDTIEDYDISINGSFVDSEFNPGTILLSDNDPDADVFAQSGSVTITNFTAYNIVFTFTFTRTDGQVITGRYDGNYLAPNGIN